MTEQPHPQAHWSRGSAGRGRGRLPPQGLDISRREAVAGDTPVTTAHLLDDSSIVDARASSMIDARTGEPSPGTV
jgi:hypothetical protein